jgi:FkbM family methyltransferase
MDLYGQEPEVFLLQALVQRLADRSVIDVGAERGAFVDSLLLGGATRIYAIEPDTDNARFLHSRFAGDPRVSVLEYAATDVDGAVELHRSVHPSGEPLSYGHTLLKRPDSDEIAWRGAVSIQGRSLASLVESGEIPARVGILKIDAEGADFAVVAGMGELECAVVVVEHWLDLPLSLGRCPWTIDDLTGVLRPRGFSEFAFLEHRGEFSILKWGDARVDRGRMGNLFFVSDDALARLMPAFLECASAIAGASLEVAERYVAEAGARLEVIEGLKEQGAGRRRVARRLGFWLRPRIGVLKQHAPMPLTVPADYFRAKPPSPAPSISIVTPSFQQGRYIGRTLYSVLSQDYPALEYVVQDGGSTDETLDVLKRFEPAVARWRSEPDQGQADAINRGFHETSGEIMAWLNADDLLLPGALAYVASYFANHPDVDVVYGNRLMIDEHDRLIGTWVLPAHDDKVLALADYVPQESLFWRRSIWESTGGQVDLSFTFALDWDLLLRFRSAGAKIIRLPRFLGAFRVHDAQKTTANEEVGLTECARLRRREHGRSLTREEVFWQLRPFLVKHMLVDLRQRVRDRFPSLRLGVNTNPDRIAVEQLLIKTNHQGSSGDSQHFIQLGADDASVSSSEARS